MEQLQKCLDDLGKKDLERFRSFLRHEAVDGCDPIRKSEVEDASVTKLVDTMTDHYGEECAVSVTLNILKKMNQNTLVLELERETDALSSLNTSGPRSLVSTSGSGERRLAYPHPEDFLAVVQQELRESLMKYGCIYEGKAEHGSQSHLNNIYTELFITEGESGPISNEHEVRKTEGSAAKRQDSQETSIECNKIFQSDAGRRVRTVLMTGIGGAGKTVCVQKFVVDWAEGSNGDVDLIFVLPFRDLRELEDGREYSLLELVHEFHQEVTDADKLRRALHKKVLFVFDGLDESSHPLDFKRNKRLTDVMKPASVDVLLTNLIKGNLLPSALIWITSRPATASRIPPASVHKVVEVRGFNDQQKEEYFKNKFRDREHISDRMISRVKSSRSLYIMCHIPVFCWVTATVLDDVTDETEIPTTLTGMYTDFLKIQTKFSSEDQNEPADHQDQTGFHKDMFVSLGRLAFHQLEKGKFLFNETDLKQCGIDISQMSAYSGVLTEMLQGKALRKKKVYCFIHLSIQEYFAALYVFLSYKNEATNPLDPTKEVQTLSDLHKSAVKRSLKSRNGHLDLFLRFLLGLSAMDPSQTFLESLLTQEEVDWDSIDETRDFIKGQIRIVSSPERCITLFHCLTELNDNSLVEEIRCCMSSGGLAGARLSPEQLSALAYAWLMSGELIDLFDLKQYYTPQGGHKRLLPVIRNTRTALLDQCLLTEKSCAVVASAMLSSPLTELDLSYNDLGDAGVSLLCASLREGSRVHSLRLDQCKLTEKCCEDLTSILCPRLKTLSLCRNALGNSGMKTICKGMKPCHLEEIRLRECELTEACCEDLASVLCSPQSKLRELDLTDNDLEDKGVTLLSAGLEDPSCVLQRLVLSGCRVTETGCASLASALRSNPSHLRELDLSYNHPGDSGVKLLSAGVEDPSCKLEKLITDHIGEHRNKPKLLKYACQLTLDPNTAHCQLCLSDRDRKVTHKVRDQGYPNSPERFDLPSPQVLCRQGLSARSYWEVEWSKGWEPDVGVTYRRIRRKGWSDSCLLGRNDHSWSLLCAFSNYSAWHNGSSASFPAPDTRKLGVYLDWAAGTLSFYSIARGVSNLLYTFHTEFTEPLYPAFKVGIEGSLSLCQLGKPIWGSQKQAR
ncbi:NACHT, LRR and PYD domains-containing protein 3-like [Megalops cyprinoides]|uniref:NACHT, LRR and PYD domains-containing protein 3-like n=1 Tax=Megalops cyprinoides TaxID=118141 RepID=UPI001864505B|nr:NACHT, LRR and PYD domains-containing protein 3-like [Megalops cyprinoides]